MGKLCCRVGLFLWLLIFPNPSYAADTALSKQIDELAKALTSDAAKDDAAQISLRNLVGKIGSLECAADPEKKADCKIEQLKSFATSTKSNFDQAKIGSVTEKQQSDLWTAVKPLLAVPVEKRDLDITKSLEFASGQFELKKDGVFEPDVDVTAIAGVIAKAAPAIIAAKPSDSLPLVKLDAMAASLETASLQLDHILAVLPAKKRINIISAWFGHIPSIKRRMPADPWAYNDRFCSATRAVRVRCQGKIACYEPATPSGNGNQTAASTTTELTGASLCGFEPAPFSDPMDKGVVVYYECLGIGFAKWRAIGAGDPVNVSGAIPLRAELRASAIEEIRCQGKVE